MITIVDPGNPKIITHEKITHIGKDIYKIVITFNSYEDSKYNSVGLPRYYVNDNEVIFFRINETQNALNYIIRIS